jgi:hypothetical protein
MKGIGRFPRTLRYGLAVGIWLLVAGIVAGLSWVIPSHAEAVSTTKVATVQPYESTYRFEAYSPPTKTLLAQAGAALKLTSSKPSNGQKDALIDAPIELQFSQPLPENFEEFQLTVNPDASLAFNSAGDRMILKPKEPLKYSTEYTLELPKQDAISLADPVKLQFQTEPQYTYKRDVQPILDARCVGCHQIGGRQRQSRIDDYDSVMAYVTPGSTDSPLIAARFVQRHANTVRAIGPTAGRRGGSPEIAYAKSIGADVGLLGTLQPNELEVVTTWIVQDKAVEDTSARRE